MALKKVLAELVCLGVLKSRKVPGYWCDLVQISLKKRQKSFARQAAGPKILMCKQAS